MSSVGAERNRRAPAEYQQRLTSAGGKNRFDEPNFRLVWSESVLSWVGGKWQNYVGSEPTLKRGVWVGETVAERLVPQYWYFQSPCWVVEKWVGPEQYGIGREDWDTAFGEWIDGKRVNQLGPFPSRGEYVYSFEVRDLDGTPLVLTSQLMDEIVWRTLTAREHSAGELKAAQDEDALQKERSEDGVVDSMTEESFDAFYGRVHEPVGIGEAKLGGPRPSEGGFGETRAKGKDQGH